MILSGRLTRDPEVRYSQGEKATCVSRFSLAVDRRGQEGADFPNIVAFGKTGEFTEKYFHKGMKVLIEGRLQTGSYKNKNGDTVYTTDVIVEDQEFAESKNASASSMSGGPAPAPAERPAPAAAIGDGFMNIPDGVEDEGLPFN